MKDIKIIEILEPERKAAIAEGILLALPDWFGLPESTREYVEQSRALPFWAVFLGEEAAGFVTLAFSSRAAAEVHCMGVLPQFHRKGIGRVLIKALETHAREAGYRLLQVKTVDEGHYPEYNRTIAFYEGMGFCRLEVFPNLWDPWNPCLVLVKALTA